MGHGNHEQKEFLHILAAESNTMTAMISNTGKNMPFMLALESVLLYMGIMESYVYC
jgi:hypothetical protein